MQLARMEILLLVNKIEIELEAVTTEGIDSPKYWYALDRIETIKDICEEFLKFNGGGSL